MKVSRKISPGRRLQTQYVRLKKELLATKKQSDKLAELLLLRQEEVKKEISRKLHDEVAQILTGINFKLSILGRTTANSNPELREKIIDAQQMVEKSVDKINGLARELYPMILDDLGLGVALESYIKAFMAETKIRVKLTSSIHSSKISDLNKIVLFRVAQESLTNIAKHSKARSASITIRKVQNNIQMMISDSGVSFKVKNLLLIGKNTRIGLIGMEERVKMAGGDFKVTSSPKKGTLVKVLIPLLKVRE
ncbi:MAG: sensor histidine kinase [Bdellovibrionota bacterium]